MATPKKDYAAIAAKHIIRPADVKSKPRLLVYSRNKKGKTTFSISAGVEKTLVLDPEAGTKEMKVKNPHVWPIDQWSDMEEAYEFLRFGDHEYEWVSVDGLTKMSNMSLRHVMRVQEERSLTRIPGFVEQRDYGKSGELMKDMLTRFHNLPMGIVFTAQERQVEAADSEEDEDMENLPSAYVPDLPKAVRGSANAIVDVIGRIYVVKNDEDKPERRLWLGESARYDTGYRSEFVLPDYIRNPTIPKLVRLMRTGSVSPKGKK
jgi:phage nucleotide-binding protein